MAPSHADAEDAVQAVQIALWRKIGQFEGRAKFTTWLYQVAVTTTIGELRRRRPVPVDVDLTTESDRPDPASQVTDVNTVRWAINQLPDDYRITLVLSAFEGLSHAEIAQILIISEGTVKSRLSRARQALHHLLTEASS